MERSEPNIGLCGKWGLQKTMELERSEEREISEWERSGAGSRVTSYNLAFDNYKNS